MKSGLLITFGASVLIAGGILFAARHWLAGGRRAIDKDFCQIDRELKARDDLIPPLLAATSGYVDPAATNEVESARAGMADARTPATKIAMDGTIQIALSRILLLQESHAELKSNADFRRVEQRLQESETRLAAARRTYNEAVTKYNAEVVGFPQNIAARIWGFRREPDYFGAELP